MLKAMPKKGATSQFFWTSSDRGFSGIQQSQRRLSPSDQTNSYLFSISGEGPLRGIRFDPFATYDKYADAGEMMIESITIYLLP
jgi:alpha-L-rhamnosidase